MLDKRFRTIDTIHKLGSYPVPKGGHSVVTMDRITTQELQGAIVVNTNANTSCDKCLGFLLDRIFSGFAAIDIPSPDKLTVPQSTILRHHPRISQKYLNDHNIPLYDNTWNWPLPKDAMPPSDADSKRSTFQHFSMQLHKLFGQLSQQKHTRAVHLLPSVIGWVHTTLAICPAMLRELVLIIVSQI